MTPLLLAALLAAAPGSVSGVVFDDANGNGRRDAGEAGLPGVCVSDGASVARTSSDGSYRIGASSARWIFVILPGDRLAVGGWYRQRREVLDFPLAPGPAPAEWRFAHLSDTHVDDADAPRMARALALARERGAAFAIVSGDLVKDALRVDEATARHEFDLYVAEAARAPLPVWNVPGNHDVFGAERPECSGADAPPACGKTLYEERLGPRYYAFNRGSVHFLVLDTVAVDEGRYYGLLDVDELSWIGAELEHLRPGTAVVTVGHIPLRTGALSLAFTADGPARTLLTVRGETSYRHVVRNAARLDSLLRPYRWTLALQGHTHVAERLRLVTGGGAARYHTAPAVARAPWSEAPCGIVVYRVRGDSIDDGEVLPLD